MNEELKPCPFCGAGNVILRKSERLHFSWVSCPDCGLEAPTETGVSDDDAVSYWNTRAALTIPQPAEARGIVEALRPFASVAEHDIGDDEADTDLFRPMHKHNKAQSLTVGDMRRALSALRANGAEREIALEGKGQR